MKKRHVKLFEDVTDWGPSNSTFNPNSSTNDKEEIVYVMSMEQTYTYVYIVPKSFNDMVIEQYGDYQRLYDNNNNDKANELLNKLYTFPKLEDNNRVESFIVY